jgi:hypothetical protein
MSELQNLFTQNIAMERQHSASGKRDWGYMRILGNSARDMSIMDRRSENFIEGASRGSWIIPKYNLCLGETVKITILGMFKVFEDVVAGIGTEDGQGKIVDFWLPSDVMNIPKANAFDHAYVDADGVEHTLRVVHWVFVRLEDYPEIEDAIIVHRSVSNRVYRDLQKDLSGSSCTQYTIELSSQEIKVGKNPAYLYPRYTLGAENYQVQDDQISLVSGGKTEEELVQILKTSQKFYKDYENAVLVTKKQNLASILGVPSVSIAAPEQSDVQSSATVTRAVRF